MRLDAPSTLRSGVLMISQKAWERKRLRTLKTVVWRALLSVILQVLEEMGFEAVETGDGARADGAKEQRIVLE